jgi:hypothetical protein
MQIPEKTEKKDDSLHPSRSLIIRREGQSNLYAAVRQTEALSGPAGATAFMKKRAAMIAGARMWK